MIKTVSLWEKEHPWCISYNCARRRCLSPRYPHYFGMDFLMTVNDFKELWFRDKAYLMRRPSIDRINNDIGYIKSKL